VDRIQLPQGRVQWRDLVNNFRLQKSTDFLDQLSPFKRLWLMGRVSEFAVIFIYYNTLLISMIDFDLCFCTEVIDGPECCELFTRI
jgi:hypothetical protein